MIYYLFNILKMLFVGQIMDACMGTPTKKQKIKMALKVGTLIQKKYWKASLIPFHCSR